MSSIEAGTGVECVMVEQIGNKLWRARDGKKALLRQEKIGGMEAWLTCTSPEAKHGAPTQRYANYALAQTRQLTRATARRAITPIRCARYSAQPWMSLFMPSAGIGQASSDFGEKRFFSASSNAFTRNTPLRPRR